MMPQLSYELIKYVFVIPEYSEQDWRESIDAADGFEKELRITQLKTLNLLENINDVDVTPARLAWMNLWTKCHSVLDGVSAALAGNSTLLLDVLDRVALETFLHVMAIIQPATKRSGTSSETIVDRLCAFTAWALGEDLRSVIECSHRSNLDMVWNPEPAREIKYNPQKREVYEGLLGELTIDVDPASLKAGRQRQVAELRNQRKRLEAWLMTPELICWKQKIRSIEEKIRPASVTFFMLMNEDDKSIRKKMVGLGLGFAYASYQQASMVIHGSTIDHLNLTCANRIIPGIFASSEEIEQRAEIVRSSCNSTALALAMMQKQLWPCP